MGRPLVLALFLLSHWPSFAQGPAPARYEPSPMPVVQAMMEAARVGAGDTVYDLGCGDGRIVIEAARRGARAVCVELDPERIRESRKNAERAGVAGDIRFVNADALRADLADATVVMLFLTPELNLALRPRLRAELAPGTRIVSHYHGMGDWARERMQHVHGDFGVRTVYTWTVPPRC